MELLHLGLIIIGIIVLVVYNKWLRNQSIRENLSMAESTGLEKKYLKTQDKYFNYRLFPQVVKGGNDDIKFVKLNREKTKLNEYTPSAKVDISEISKKIEQCRIIDRTKECSNISAYGCGYCWETDKIIYGDANGPKTDVCSKKGWVAPGPRTGYYCQKKKDQSLCNQMKDCGDATGDKSICGWCPLKAKGVPKKLGPSGKGWVAKYPDDKCDWKKFLKSTGASVGTPSKWLGWTPSKGGYPNRDPKKGGEPLNKGDADCDRDEDCGPGLKCGHDGRVDGKLGIPGIIDSRTGKTPGPPPAGYRDYCYDPNFNVWHGTLIEPKDCKRFNQMFPCIGPTMFTGPHTDKCLNSLWRKSGCGGSLRDRVTDRQDYIAWNGGQGSSCPSHNSKCTPTNGMSYGNVESNMRSFPNSARQSKNYNKAKAAHKKCFGFDVNPCESRFLAEGRPLDCSRKLYAQSGCSIKGELNPEKQKTWPNFYINSQNNIKKITQHGSVGQYTSALSRERYKANIGKIRPKSNFDNAITDNMMCYGTKPSIPWTKPCWTDFIIIMTSTPGIQLNRTTGRLSFAKSAASTKSLLPITNNSSGGWKAPFAWAANFEVSKQNYEQKYFPFWNFIKAAREYWNKNWSVFKQKMLLVPSVKLGSPSSVSRWYGWSEGRGRHPGRGKTRAGEGDCDRNSDCAPGLVCGHNSTRLPGVRNTGVMGSGRDFCYNPNALTSSQSRSSANYTVRSKNTNCPAGMEITNHSECHNAISKLGLKSNPWWHGNHPNIPKGCTWTDAVMGNRSRGSLSHWNAWTSSAGSPRFDLHPICKSITSVPASGDLLKFLSGSPFDTLVGGTKSTANANNRGLFWKYGNERYLTKHAFMNENFPYWHFLRTAEKN